MKKSNKIIMFIFLAVSPFLFSSCESCSRMKKNWSSEMSGGLERTIKVYDYNGNLLYEKEGKFDIHSSSSNNGSVYFDIETPEGRKRTAIWGGIIAREKGCLISSLRSGY